MQWGIQCTDLPDTHTLKLLEAAKERGLPTFGIGVTPFEHKLLGIEEIDPSMPCMFYGSTQLMDELKNHPEFSPAMFYNPDWYNPFLLWPIREHLLNALLDLMLVSQLREEWVKQPTFIKSVLPKRVTGMVLEPEKDDWDTWLIEHAHLEGKERLAISPVQIIDREWRFFILGGEVITGSMYRRDGYKTIFEAVSKEAWDAAVYFAHLGPSKNIVMDIALLRDGSYKIIEFNSVNSSGFYNCDVGKIVDRIEKMYAPNESKQKERDSTASKSIETSNAV